MLLAACTPRAGEPPAAAIGFNPSGPNAAEYGESGGAFPRATRANWWQQPYLIDAHSRFAEFMPARRVGRAEVVRPLARSTDLPSITYRYQNAARTIDEYLARNPVTGLLIAQDGVILVERYQYGRSDKSQFTSWSMAKTFVSMLIGIALEEGAIRSLDDRPSDYVAGLGGTEYGRTPLRHLLTMSSGVKFREDYDGSDDISILSRATLGGGNGALATLPRFNERLVPPGTRHYYASAETAVLGLVLAAAVRRPLADYLSEKIWRPLGMESDAAWLIDSAGSEAAYCCLNAVLRDYARFALMLAEDGRAGGRQVIPSAWLKEATAIQGSHLAPGTANRFWGYGYQTWIFPGGRGDFALLGVRGQAIYVDPRSKLVMVNTAVRPNPRDPGTAETVALSTGLRETLGRR